MNMNFVVYPIKDVVFNVDVDFVRMLRDSHRGPPVQSSGVILTCNLRLLRCPRKARKALFHEMRNRTPMKLRRTHSKGSK
jgi:hypothetical protein